MKKLSPIIIFCIVCLMASYSIVNAVIIENPLKSDSITGILESVTNFIAFLASGVAVIMIIWGGIVYTTAGSSEERTKDAKKTIQWALIGLAIVWSAKFLIEVLGWILGKNE